MYKNAPLLSKIGPWESHFPKISCNILSLVTGLGPNLSFPIISLAIPLFNKVLRTIK